MSDEIQEIDNIERDWDPDCPAGCECKICFDNSFADGYW